MSSRRLPTVLQAPGGRLEAALRSALRSALRALSVALSVVFSVVLSGVFSCFPLSVVLSGSDLRVFSVASSNEPPEKILVPSTAPRSALRSLSVREAQSDLNALSIGSSSLGFQMYLRASSVPPSNCPPLWYDLKKNYTFMVLL